MNLNRTHMQSPTFKSIFIASAITFVVLSLTANAGEEPAARRSKAMVKRKAVIVEPSRKSERVVKEDYSVYRNIPPAYEIKRRRGR